MNFSTNLEVHISQKSGKMNTLEALQPVTCIFQLFGVSVTQFCRIKYIPLDRVIKYYIIFYITIRFSVFCYISSKYNLLPTEDKTNSVIELLAIVTIHLFEIIILMEAFFKAHQEKIFLENFLEIDDILIQNFGIDLKISRLRKSAMIRLIIWMIIIGIDVGNRLIKRYNSEYFGQELIWTLAFSTASLTYLQIITWADLIRYRLRILTRLIYALECGRNEKNKREKLNKPNDSDWEMVRSNRIGNANESNNVVDDTHILNQLNVICDLYNRLWMQAKRLNERFTFSMVLSIGNDYGYLVIESFFIFICLRKIETCDLLRADFSLWIVNVFHLSMLSMVGQKMASEALRVAYAIHRNKFIRSSAKLSSFVC